MALTRIDCHFFRGAQTTADTSAFVALNPSATPGSMVVACAGAARESLGSQVACKLALEHFVGGVLDFFDHVHHDDREPAEQEIEISLEVLEAAFKNANTSVYQFGHSLAAGGRLAASLLGIVIQDNVAAAGRVGAGSAYLYRQGDLFPFFVSDDIGSIDSEAARGDGLVGASSLVAVDLASVPIQEADTIFVFSERLTEKQEEALIRAAEDIKSASAAQCETVARILFSDVRRLQFAMLARIGPEAIYLSRDRRREVSTR